MTHEFDDLSIQHADVVPEGSCLLLAAEVSQSQNGLKPMKAAPTRKLMGPFTAERLMPRVGSFWHGYSIQS